MVDAVVYPKPAEKVFWRRIGVREIMDEQVTGIAQHKARQKRKGMVVHQQVRGSQQDKQNGDAQDWRHGQPLLIFREFVVYPMDCVLDFAACCGVRAHVEQIPVSEVFGQGES